MSQENVETFKRAVEAWNRDDFDTWINQFDPEVEWFALMEVFRGHAEARRAWESFKGDMRLTIGFEEIRDLGESVLALGEIKGSGRTTGLAASGEIGQWVTYRGRKALTLHDFGSHAEALKAAGLSE